MAVDIESVAEQTVRQFQESLSGKRAATGTKMLDREEKEHALQIASLVQQSLERESPDSFFDIEVGALSIKIHKRPKDPFRQ